MTFNTKQQPLNGIFLQAFAMPADTPIGVLIQYLIVFVAKTS
jgi:hypothetical protein